MSTQVSTPRGDEVRAAVFTAPGKPLESRTLASPPPGPGEVRVRVRCCTVCGSDLHSYEGRRSAPAPSVLGHEILGEVESFGPGEPVTDHAGEPLHIGDRVTWSIAASCGVCFFCTRDLPQKCERLFKYGHESLESDRPLSGGLAEHCLLAPGTTIVKLPASLPDLVACPVNCATATVAAALRLGGVGGDARDSGQTVMVQGMGMLGLTAAAMARALGARHVIGCDVDARRLELAERFGVDVPVNVATDSEALARTVRRVTADRGADVALELAGSVEAMRAALPALRTGGTYVMVGAVFRTPEWPIDPETLVRRMLTIRGLHNYAPCDLVAAVRFLSEHHAHYPFEQLVEGPWPLERAGEAFEHALAQRPLRVAVAP